MVKTVLGVNHRGLTDWVIQRISAIVMVLYSVGMIAFFLTHPNMAFYDWHGLFTHLWMKVATLTVLTLLLFHAWVGMWTIFTDYIKLAVLRFILHVIVFIALVAFFFEGALILWGV